MAEVKNICLEALERHCASGDMGRLDFHRGSYDGQIFTDNGLIVHAQLSGLDGIPALFRLFDWGDAETTWQAGVTPEKASLHITMDEAGALYAENLHDRAELEAKEKKRLTRRSSHRKPLLGRPSASNRYSSTTPFPWSVPMPRFSPAASPLRMPPKAVT